MLNNNKRSTPFHQELKGRQNYGYENQPTGIHIWRVLFVILYTAAYKPWHAIVIRTDSNMVHSYQVLDILYVVWN